MNKKFILIIVVFLAIILIAGVLLINKKPQIKEGTKEGVKTQELTANEKKAVSICDKLTRKEWKDRCLAVINKDFSLCTGLLSDKYQDAVCYRVIAVAKADPLICEKIEVSKDRCYAEAAKTKPDMSLCDKVIEKNFKNRCYWNIAEAKQDFSFCEKITDDQDWRNRCFATMKNNSLLCDKIDQQFEKNICYLDIAIKKNDESLCKKMDETEIVEEWKQDKQTRCMAMVSKDGSLCEKINRRSMKESCYFGVAIEKKDDSLCNKTGIEEDACYWSIALGILNLSISPF